MERATTLANSADPRGPERAVLVAVELLRPRAAEPASPAFDADDALAELTELARGAGANVVERVRQRRPKADAATLIGAGKLEELRGRVAALAADLVIFENELTPTQQRNLERAVEARVVDRTQLILDIFARHARTREGQLQVELAQLEYLLPRLTGRGAAMSRLGGGIGTRGPGETQLESDRRRIHQRIRRLRLSLEDVRRHRREQRSQREAVPLATAALVGYTNAGKSSLFNRLTQAGVLASSRMFATLDPTVRALTLPSRRKLLVSDTVGFLRRLPHGLISAFRATLEEVERASLILHVFDAAAPHRDEYAQQVRRVLAELGVEGAPEILVANKLDLVPAEERPARLRLGGETALGVSALTGEGIPQLLAALDQAMPADDWAAIRVRLPHAAGGLLHLVHERGEVLREAHLANGVDLEARVPSSLMARLRPYRVSRGSRRLRRGQNPRERPRNSEGRPAPGE